MYVHDFVIQFHLQACTWNSCTCLLIWWFGPSNQNCRDTIHWLSILLFSGIECNRAVSQEKVPEVRSFCQTKRKNGLAHYAPIFLLVWHSLLERTPPPQIEKKKKKNLKSWCHTKRRMRASCACPSFHWYNNDQAVIICRLSVLAMTQDLGTFSCEVAGIIFIPFRANSRPAQLEVLLECKVNKYSKLPLNMQTRWQT